MAALSRKLGLFLLGCLIVVPILAIDLVAGYGVLRTDPGRVAAAAAVERLLGTPGDTEVRITDLSGSLLRNPRVAAVTVADAGGVWLEIRNLAIDWRPLALLAGRAEIDRVTADSIRIVRQPSVVPAEDAGPEGLPTLPVALRVGRLTASEIRLDAPVLGAPAAFRLDASLASRDAQVIQTALRLERTDGGKGHVHARAVFTPAEGTLAVDATAREPKGGLLARLLDLPGLPAVTLSVRGDGPISDWRGNLVLEAEGLASANAVLGVAGHGPYTLSARGTAELARALDQRFARLVAPAVAFDVAAAWSPGTDDLALTRVRLASDAIAIDAKGGLKTDSLAVRATGKAKVAKPELLRGLIAPFAVERLSASTTVEGTLRRPKIRATVKVSGLRAPEATLGEGDLRLTATPHPKAANPQWAVEGGIDVQTIAFDRPFLTSLVGSKSTVQFSGDVDVVKASIQNARFDVTAENASVRGTGHADVAAADGAATVAVAVKDLSRLSRYATMKLAGSLDVDADVTFDRSGATARLKGGPKRLEIDDPVLKALLGRAPNIVGTARATSEGGIVLSDLSLRGAAIALDVASLSTDGERMDTRYRARIANLTPVAKALGVSAGGVATTTGSVRGSLSDLKVEGTIDASALRWDARNVGSANGKYALAVGGANVGGDVSVAAVTGAGRFDLATRVTVSQTDTVRLTGLTLKGDAIDFRGRLDIPASGIVAGDLKGRVSELERWASLLDVPMTGSADIDLALRASPGGQAARLKFIGRDVVYDSETTVAALSGELSATGIGKNPRTTWRVTARDLRSAIAALEAATLSGSGDLRDAVARFSVKGDMAGRLDVAGEARIQRHGEDLRLTLRQLKGVAAGQPILLRKPGVYAEERGQLDVSLPDLSWGKGTVVGGVHLDDKSVTGRVAVRRLPAAAIAGFVPGLKATGRVDLTASLSGTPADPDGDLRLTIAGLKMKSEETGKLPALTGAIAGKIRKGRIRLSAKIDGLGDAGLNGAAELPLRIAASPPTVVLPPDGPIDGQVTWRGDVGAIAPLLPLGEHRIKGALALSARATGTVARPRVKGQVEWTGGNYENIETGTILRDIQIRAEGDENRISLDRATATDGGKGRLTASGGVSMGDAPTPVVSLNAKLTNLTLVRRDDVTASASGSVRVGGPIDELKVAGRIVTDQVEATVVDSLPPQVVDLKVVEVNAPAGTRTPPRRRKGPGAGSGIGLALDVSMPRRVFLRGRGLESEWAGELRITGTTEAPTIKGELRPVRGRFDLAGKIFKLGDGRVTFSGGNKVDPVLDIPADYTASDITATVRITGTASKPKIALTSTPSLPQDEILSRVLFNKGVGRLTAAEAAQLGAAVASLTGLDGGGLGVLDRVRQAIGVDALRVGKDDNGKASVGVGKYVTDDVYVGVDKGTSQKSGNVTVEVTVVPNVTVKSDVGADARSRVGVNWKLDY